MSKSPSLANDVKCIENSSRFFMAYSNSIKKKYEHTKNTPVKIAAASVPDSMSDKMTHNRGTINSEVAFFVMITITVSNKTVMRIKINTATTGISSDILPGIKNECVMINTSATVAVTVKIFFIKFNGKYFKLAEGKSTRSKPMPYMRTTEVKKR
jgi:hypothetical protein